VSNDVQKLTLERHCETGLVGVNVGVGDGVGYVVGIFCSWLPDELKSMS
jgi:hypothetical protein